MVTSRWPLANDAPGSSGRSAGSSAARRCCQPTAQSSGAVTGAMLRRGLRHGVADALQVQPAVALTSRLRSVGARASPARRHRCSSRSRSDPAPSSDCSRFRLRRGGWIVPSGKRVHGSVCENGSRRRGAVSLRYPTAANGIGWRNLYRVVSRIKTWCAHRGPNRSSLPPHVGRPCAGSRRRRSRQFHSS